MIRVTEANKLQIWMSINVNLWLENESMSSLQ